MLTRTESLDTLSPCESICSDDMMMDFESNSSIDSIDRYVLFFIYKFYLFYLINIKFCLYLLEMHVQMEVEVDQHYIH